MTFSAYSIPETPPAELLAELDAAAEALDALTARAAELTLAMDEERRRLRIELRADGELRALTPTQLLELLG
ncbi:MAG TPA: hypothetical protein VJS87_00655 [Solirubrobacterales bacterium]|jgi:hypothetical protein|nr:hypothetical protein [Solirubrobacterales bacterium]